MSEPRMKSAWEIAMEKAEKLGKPSEEEMRKTRQDTYGPIGQGLAKKYLSGGMPLRELQREVGKYNGEEKKVVTESLAGVLRDSITLDNPAEAARALEGWSALKLSKETERAIADINALLADYARAKETHQAGAAVEAAGDMARELEEDGISGSALVVNSGRSAQVVQRLDEVKKEYEVRLRTLKEKLAL